MSDPRGQATLCQEVETELWELCQECRKKFPIIKEYTEKAILKLKHHRELAERAAKADKAPGSQAPALVFPLDEVLRAILMACETFQGKIVLLSLSCLQRLIHRRVLKDETVAIVINLMKEQAANGDESVQLKVLQTIMATPAHMTLLNELVVEQLMQLLHVLHNSSAPSVHHTACAGLRQLAEFMSDSAAAAASRQPAASGAGVAAPKLDSIRPVIKARATALPSVNPSQPSLNLAPPVRMFVTFMQDLCVMADYDPQSLSMRYAIDSVERMRTGSREGFWLATVKFPRPLCLELLSTCVAAHPSIFASGPECFQLLRHNICAALLKNLQSCYDFAILIRSVHLLQQILKSPEVASLLMHEVQIFLHLMLDLTSAERSPWQRATALEFLQSLCEDPAMLSLLYEHGSASPPSPRKGPGPDRSPQAASGPRTFLELVNSLSKLIHQVCFSAGTDSGSLLQSATSAGAAGPAPGPPRPPAVDAGRGPLAGGVGTFPGLLGLGSVAFGARDGVGGPCATAADAGSRPPSKDGGGGGGATSSDPRKRRGGKLLQMMSDSEPPAVPPSLLVSLVVESVLSIVATLYKLLLDAVLPDTRDHGGSDPASPASSGGLAHLAGEAPVEALSRHCTPLSGDLTPKQHQVRSMLEACWASLLSALSLLMHGTMDEQCLQQALRCMQTLLFCCGRLSLGQARDACLLQLSRYALPGPSHEADADAAAAGGLVGGGLTMKNVLCFKALLHFCFYFGRLLGIAGWAIVLRAFGGLERALVKVSRTQSELTVLRQALDSLFETTSQLDMEALSDIIEAMGQTMKGATEGASGQQGSKGALTQEGGDDGALVLDRLVELCSFNLGRLAHIWGQVLRVVKEVCMSEERGELRGSAAAALCRILAQALRKGALALEPRPEAAQDELLRSLEALLRAPHEETRAMVCEGMLAILQASGQELYPAAWGTMIHLVATGSRVELERVGVQFFLPEALDPLAAAGSTASSTVVQERKSSSASTSAEGRDASTVLPTLFQLLELLVHDFMEHVPLSSVPLLTASIGAFARFTGLGVNSSLTAVGFLWKVADALAGPVGAGPSAAAGAANAVAAGAASAAAAAAGSSASGAGGGRTGGLFEELWVQLFMHLRVIAVDSRPEVRNCAVKSLTSALLAHGRKVGVVCYKRCLQDILIEVLAEIQEQGRIARCNKGATSGACLIVHHSRDTPEKQWDETLVLAVEGVRRVLGNFAEEAGVVAFAPLAYALLLQVQASMCVLSPEVSGTALRALVDLMRIPASSQVFKVEGTLIPDPALPAHGKGKTSVWLLCWDVLLGVTRLCLASEVPEALVEMFSSTLNSLRNSHQHLFSPVQHGIFLHLALALTTEPSFYLPASTPLRSTAAAAPSTGARPPTSGPSATASPSAVVASAPSSARAPAGAQAPGAAAGDSQSMAEALAAAARACGGQGGEEANARDRDVFAGIAAAPESMWRVDARRPGDTAKRSYTKAPAAVSCFVDANQSRNLDIKSVDYALQALERPPGALGGVAEGGEGAATTPDEAFQAFLGTSQSPTHRTMLHIAAPRLQHVQGFAFGLLEETRGFPEPSLEVLFLFLCCSMFLDSRRVLLDTNKVALAARAMCLLVLFNRRVVVHNLRRLRSAVERERASAGEHLEALLGTAMPHLLRVLTALAASRGSPELRDSGLWKLALETIVYLVDDTLPAAERAGCCQKACAAYWAAVSDALATAVASALPEPRAAAPAPPPAQASVALLASAVGDLAALRILACGTAPQKVLERAVRILTEIDAFCSHLGADRGQLDHLFDLCAGAQDGRAGSKGQAGATGSESVEGGASIGAAALTARGGAPARPPARAQERATLVAVAMPALLARVRALLTAFAEDEARAGANGLPPRRAEEVAQVLARLAKARVDETARAALAPSGAGKARAACELAGPCGFAMALLPQLATLAASADSGVRRGVREALCGLSTELGL